MASYTVEENSLVFSNGKATNFPLPIAGVVDADDVLLVRLQVPADTIFNENVFGVSAQGDVLWQIGHQRFVLERSPYMWVESRDGLAYLGNLSDDVLTVEPRTGRVLGRSFVR